MCKVDLQALSYAKVLSEIHLYNAAPNPIHAMALYKVNIKIMRIGIFSLIILEKISHHPFLKTFLKKKKATFIQQGPVVPKAFSLNGG